jgi:hypothetical protein
MQRALIVSVSTVVATYALTAIALDLFVDMNRVRAWVEPRASAALNRSVTIGEARIHLLPRPSFRLTSIEVNNHAGFDGPTLARLDEARLDVAWLPLAIGRVSVKRVHLEGAMVHLAVDERGVSNFGDLAPRRAAPTESPLSAPFASSVRRISVSDGSLSFFDASRARSFVIAGGEADATVAAGEQGSWRAEVVLAADSLLARMESVGEGILRTAGPTAKLTAGGDRPLSEIDLEDGFIALAGDTLGVRGRIAGLSGTQPSFDLQLTNAEMSARALEALFPSDLRSSLLPRAEGTIAVTLQIQGGLSSADRPVVRGSAKLDDITLRIRGDAIAERVDGVLGIDATTLHLDSLTGLLAGGPFALEGTVARDERLTTAFVARAQPDLDALDRIGLLTDGMTLSGDAELDLSVSGSLRALDSLRVEGTAALEGFQLKHARLSAPLYVAAGVVALVETEVHWSDLDVLVGTDAIRTTGVLQDPASLWSAGDVTPRVDVRMSGPRLDLGVLLPSGEPERSASYARRALAQIGGQTLDGSSPSALASERGLSRPERSPVLGSVSLAVDTLIYGRYALEHAITRVDLSDSAISIPDATFGAWGGQVHASLLLGVGASPRQPFALALGLEGVDAAHFLADVMGVTQGMVGALDMDLEIAGFTDGRVLPLADRLTGRARLALEDGSIAGTGVNAALADFLEASQWAEIPFSIAHADVRIAEGGLDLVEAELTGEVARIVLSGRLDFGGAADVSVALSIPPRQLATVSLRRTGIGPSVVEQLRTAGRPLDLGLHMSGPIGAPSLEPDASNAVALARR